MKVTGPRIKEAPKSEPKSEPVRIDVRGGDRKGASGKVSRSGESHSDNVQFIAAKPRDTFQAKPKPTFTPSQPDGGTRAGNLRLGEGHADNISKGPRGSSGSPQTVQAGSIHTLLNRLFPKPGNTRPEHPSNIGTNGSRIRPGDGHGDLVTLGENPTRGIDPGAGIGIVPPKTTAPAGPSAPVADSGTGSKPKALLSKDYLEGLNSPELTPRLVNKLSKATTLRKVEKLTRDLTFGLRTDIMRTARLAADDARYGGSKADNLQN